MMSRGLQQALMVAGILGGLFLGGYYLFAPKTIQIKSNPSNSHKAKLIRHDGIDVNFRVTVDGSDVYASPDFAPVQLDFREQIAWDKTGNVVVLEVAGKRLFAYDAEQKRPLTSSELSAVSYHPFSEYGFEGKLFEE